MIHSPKATGSISLFLLRSSATHTLDLSQLISTSIHLVIKIYFDSTLHKIKVASL